MENISKKRIFLVGCPRSGTTLLQSLLAAHPQIISYPESHFFNNLLPREKWKRYLYPPGLVLRRTKPRFKKFLLDLGREDLMYCIPKYAMLQRQYINAFLRVLDILAEEEKKDILLEKTPGHLYYIDYIEKNLKEPKFIHIIRNGADVVASLYQVSQQDPKVWYATRNIDQCITRWKNSIKISLRYTNKANHIVVFYERLVENTRSELEKICDFLNISFEEIMLTDYSKSTQKIVLGNEPWKASVETPIKNTTGNKFYNLFDQKTRDYILQEISTVELI